jgi:hypothetical protein
VPDVPGTGRTGAGHDGEHDGEHHAAGWRRTPVETPHREGDQDMTQGNPPSATGRTRARGPLGAAVAVLAATPPARAAGRAARTYRRGRFAFLVAAGYAALVVLVCLVEIVAPHLPPEIAGLWNGPTAFVAWVVTMPISVPLIALAAWLRVPDRLFTAFLYLTPLASLLQAWLMWRLLRGRRIDAGA